MPDLNAALTLSPDAAIAYFTAKGFTPTQGWKDLQDEVHAVQFAVAGITKLDVLNDIHQGLAGALKNGTTLSQFQDELEPTLRRKGWLGSGLVANDDGELLGKQLMPYRLETIFRTNVQSAYAAGRYRWMMSTVKERPYWQYIAVMDDRTRPAHAALNGRIFRWDDPIWQTLFPPNGYNCRCYVRALTQAQVDAHPVGVESSEGYLVTVQQPYGTDGEMRPVKAFRDPKSGQLLTPDAGFHLNAGRSYLAGLGQTLLEKGTTAAPELASVAVRETLSNNRLASAMNRDLHQWTQGLDEHHAGDFRRIGALSPQVQSLLQADGAPVAPVITLPAETVLACREPGASLWPRLVSAMLYPLAVLLRDDRLCLLTQENGDARAVVLARCGDGWQVAGIHPWTSDDAANAEILDGQLPEVS
ncbi:minor capsid protein [Salmonella enterica]|nr:minor capsid protein [Salmonella enterica]ELN0443663.1 minor capsid protein [Salmonella enterica]